MKIGLSLHGDISISQILFVGALKSSFYFAMKKILPLIETNSKFGSENQRENQ